MRGAVRLRCVLLFACIVVVGSMFLPCAGKAQAVTLQALDVEHLTQYSSTVCVARTLSVSTRFVPGDRSSASLGSVETVVGLEVVDVLKGVLPPYTTLVLPGGTAGGLTMTVDWVPGFAAGETSVLFLDALGRPVGGPQGKIALVDGELPSLGMSMRQLRERVLTATAGQGSAAVKTPGSYLGTPVGAAASGVAVIEAIAPSSGSAGTGSQVTIKGSGFGATQDTGEVRFWYGNVDQATISAPVVSWSDSQIVCVVPTAILNDYEASAGSGPVTVTTGDGQTSNGVDFHVTFGSSGRRWASHRYGFRVNPNTADTTNVRGMIDAAAGSWNAVSNFQLLDTGTCTTTSDDVGDGYNDLFWSSTKLPSGVVAVTESRTPADDPNTFLEADIVFNDTLQWGDGTNGTVDVQAVALHEMGHVLGLLDLYGGHDIGKAMYGMEQAFSGAPRTLTSDDIAGAVYLYGGGNGGGGGTGDEGTVGWTPDDSQLFSDVSADDPYFMAIASLAGNGVVTGFANGTFKPDGPVTRQQFAKMIVKALGLEVTGKEVCPFTDVVSQTGSDPLYPSKYVAVCAANGITAGKTETTFAPEERVTRQQLVSMVARAANLADPPAQFDPGFSGAQFSMQDHFANATRADYVGLLEGVVGVGPGYDFESAASRAECAQILNTLRLEQPRQGPHVLFSDDFAASRAGWPAYQWPDWRWLFDPGLEEYTSGIDTAGTTVLSTLPVQWGDSTIVVDAHAASNAMDVRYGVAFYVSGDSEAFYGFTVSNQGYWELWRKTGGLWGKEQTLAKKNCLPIHRGIGWNRVKVTVEDSTAELWVNGAHVYTFSALEGQPGLVGLVAGAVSGALLPAAVAFDNFKVWSAE